MNVKEPIGHGILGAGSIARVHSDVSKRVGFELVAVSDIKEQNAQMFAEWKGAKRSYPDYAKLLQDPEIDLVSICLPNFLHAQWAVKAAKANKHVICEKPICMNFKELSEIKKAVDVSGTRFFYAEELCYIPAFVKAKEIIDQGAIGEVIYVRQREMHAGPYSLWFFEPEQAGGGALVDMGCHGIGLVNWLCGMAPKRVFARIDRLLHKDIKVDDYALVLIEYANGALGISESGWCLKEAKCESTLEVFGTRGVIKTSVAPYTQVQIFSEEGYGMAPELTKGYSWDYSDEYWELGYEGEFKHFKECLLKGERETTGLAEAELVLEIMMAAYHSCSRESWVDLPFKPEVRYPLELIGWEL